MKHAELLITCNVADDHPGVQVIEKLGREYPGIWDLMRELKRLAILRTSLECMGDWPSWCHFPRKLLVALARDEPRDLLLSFLSQIKGMSESAKGALKALPLLTPAQINALPAFAAWRERHIVYRYAPGYETAVVARESPVPVKPFFALNGWSVYVEMPSLMVSHGQWFWLDVFEDDIPLLQTTYIHSNGHLEATCIPLAGGTIDESLKLLATKRSIDQAKRGRLEKLWQAYVHIVWEIVTEGFLDAFSEEIVL